MDTNSHPVAVLEIGSTGIRLIVAEISGNGQWQVLDRIGKPVALGKDVFNSGQVTRESLLECLSVLRNFREFLKGWNISGSDVHVIATSALRAARNRDMFTDRVMLETGFNLKIVEGIEENRLMYLAVQFAIKNDLPLFWRGNSMILEMGGGSTEIMLLRRGQIVSAHSLRMGTILINQAIRRSASWAEDRYLQENLRNTAELLGTEMELSHVRTFVVAGSDARVAALQVGKELNENCFTILRETFIQFVEQVQNYSVEECMNKLQINSAEAKIFIPGIIVYRYLLEKTGAAQVVVPNVSIREGLLIDLALGIDSGLREDFYSQIYASAINLGRKYHFDEAHHRHVADFCLTMFDSLIPEHGMNRRDRMRLEVAALLHDIGMFIRASGHQMHGQYIVSNAEIFGLHREELELIANVIRYHRGDLPNPADINYIALQREDRIRMLKMAAILRVADALDRGHSRQIKKITLERKNETIIINTEGNRDLSLEQIGLEEKANMFQDVFGYKIILN
ncbi:MAG: HD domain-containing protein [Treponema sp.]|nr:HD domain-containing protein [Treponema sp.]